MRASIIVVLAIWLVSGPSALVAQAELSGSGVVSGGLLSDLSLGPLSLSGIVAFSSQVDDWLYSRIEISVTSFPVALTGWDPAMAALLSPDAAFLGEFGMVSLGEAWMFLEFPFLPSLSLQAGEILYRPGRADMLRPNDIFCASDLRDPFSFGNKLPALGSLASWTMPWLDATLELAWAPVSPKAALSPFMASLVQARVADQYRLLVDTAWSATIAEIDAELDEDDFTKDKPRHHASPEVDYSDWSLSVDGPDAMLSDGTWALRLNASLWGFDLGFQAVRRISDIPYVSSISFDQRTEIFLDNFRIEYSGWLGTPNPTCDSVSTITSFTQSYTLSYLGEWQCGFDVVKDFSIFMAWFELGAFFPDRAVTLVTVDGTVTVIKPSSGGIDRRTVTAKVENDPVDPYVKWTFGLDRFFDGGWYLNLQVAHGSPMERGETGFLSCQDYLTFLVRKSFLGDTLVFDLLLVGNAEDAIFLLSSPFEPDRWLSGSAALVDLSASWKASDSVTILAGARAILADPASVATLGALRGMDSLRVTLVWSW